MSRLQALVIAAYVFSIFLMLLGPAYLSWPRACSVRTFLRRGEVEGAEEQRPPAQPEAPRDGPWFLANTVYAPLSGVVLLAVASAVGSATGAMEPLITAATVGRAIVRNFDVVIIIISYAYLCVSLDASGFFQTVAEWAVAASRGDGRRLLAATFGVVSFLTFFTSNDVVIVALTPVLMRAGIAGRVRNVRPMLLTQYIAANTASMGLLVGNPTNIILGAGLGLGFVDYLLEMALPTVAATAAAGATLMAIFVWCPCFEDRQPLTFYVKEETPAPQYEDLLGDSGYSDGIGSGGSKPARLEGVLAADRDARCRSSEPLGVVAVGGDGAISFGSLGATDAADAVSAAIASAAAAAAAAAASAVTTSSATFSAAPRGQATALAAIIDCAAEEGCIGRAEYGAPLPPRQQHMWTADSDCGERKVAVEAMATLQPQLEPQQQLRWRLAAKDRDSQPAKGQAWLQQSPAAVMAAALVENLVRGAATATAGAREAAAAADEADLGPLMRQKTTVRTKVGFFLAALGLLSASDYLGVPMWVVAAAAGSAVLVADVGLAAAGAGAAGAARYIRYAFGRVPWAIAPFVFSMFVLVSALTAAGLTRAIADAAVVAGSGGTYDGSASGNNCYSSIGSDSSGSGSSNGTDGGGGGESSSEECDGGGSFGSLVGTAAFFAASSALVVNVLNNLPATVLVVDALPVLCRAYNRRRFSAAVMGLLVGLNVGAYLTLVGALAGLMWAAIMRSHPGVMRKVPSPSGGGNDGGSRSDGDGRSGGVVRAGGNGGASVGSEDGGVGGGGDSSGVLGGRRRGAGPTDAIINGDGGGGRRDGAFGRGVCSSTESSWDGGGVLLPDGWALGKYGGLTLLPVLAVSSLTVAAAAIYSDPG